MAEERKFDIQKKGYNIAQVDHAVEDLKERNTYLLARVNELEQKLDSARRVIRRFSEKENGLRKSIADSKRAAVTMLADTKERSDALLDSARENCGEIISDLDMQISERIKHYDGIRQEVLDFKDRLFALYSDHIDLVEKIATEAETFTYEPDYSKLSDAIDTFENSETTEIVDPVFEDYPEESIFSDIDIGDKNDDLKLENDSEEKGNDDSEKLVLTMQDGEDNADGEASQDEELAFSEDLQEDNIDAKEQEAETEDEEVDEETSDFGDDGLSEDESFSDVEAAEEETDAFSNEDLSDDALTEEEPVQEEPIAEEDVKEDIAVENAEEEKDSSFDEFFEETLNSINDFISDEDYDENNDSELLGDEDDSFSEEAEEDSSEEKTLSEADEYLQFLTDFINDDNNFDD